MAAAFLSFHRGIETEMRQAAHRLQAIASGNNATLYLLVASRRYPEALRNAAQFYPELACDREPEISRLNLPAAINVSLAVEKTGDP
jgi:hypothetical protein